MICKKPKKGKTAEMIAEKLEIDISRIRKLTEEKYELE